MDRDATPVAHGDDAVSPHYAARVEQTALWLRDYLPKGNDCTFIVIAGSGLGGFVRRVHPIQKARFGQIPNVGNPTVAGHQGELVVARVNAAAHPVLLFSGRRHLYEGLSAPDATLPLRAALLAYPNARRVIISNAAGGLNPDFHVGDLMLIRNQVNWTFRNPLIGMNLPQWGDRFPDLSDVYSRRLAQVARQAGAQTGATLREGVYVGLTGPAYETRAEIAMLGKLIGADAVGMSTVPEALVCAHARCETLGVSFISNSHARPSVTSHAEVMENSRLVEERFGRLIEEILKSQNLPLA